MANKIRVRIAPSPTGYVHVGNTHTAYFNYIFAKQHDGEFVLRLDDTDLERHVDDAEEKVYEMWKWLGLEWQEGPDIGGPHEPYKQSERLERYKEVVEELLEKGKAYHDDGAVRFKIGEGDPIIVKDMMRGDVVFERENLKDFVILKSNGYPTYQFATAVDEVDFEITHIIRGEDHLSNTPIQLLVIRELSDIDPIYAHLPLLRNPDKSKLSKRQGHVSLEWYRENGYLPEALKNFFALMGWAHPDQTEVFSQSELEKHFKMEDVSVRAPVFNLEKLTWLNGVYIREFSDEKLYEELLTYSGTYNLELHDILLKRKEYVMKVIPLIKERLETYAMFPEITSFFFNEEIEIPEERIFTIISDDDARRSYIENCITELDTLEEWTIESLEESMRNLQSSMQLKPKHAFMTLRYAITGQKATPPLFDTMYVLDRELVISRLNKTLQLIDNKNN